MHNIQSPDLSDSGIDRLVTTGLPRITNDDVLDNIVHVEYVKHVSRSGQILRWAVLTTKNGFAVTGRPSAAVCAGNDNPAIGEKVAYDNAKQELWPLMGYQLMERLHKGGMQ